MARQKLTERVDEYTLTLTQTHGGLWWGELHSAAGYSMWVGGLHHSSADARREAQTAYSVLPLVVA